MDENSALSSLSKENIVPNLSVLSESLKSSLGVGSTKSKRGQWYSPCNSPLLKKQASPDDKLPMLKLNHFEKTPRVLFGSVKLGSSKIEELVVWNPHAETQTLRVEKSPSKKGFLLDCTDEGPNDFLTLEPDEEVVLPIKWEPMEAGRCREIIIFKWNETHRLQVILMGNAVDTTTKKKRKSVLGKSQSFNTSATTRKPFKPQFTMVTKDPISSQIKQYEFGQKIPETKEAPIEDERRETYVVTNSDVPPQDERRETFAVKKPELTKEPRCTDTIKKERVISNQKAKSMPRHIEFKPEEAQPKYDKDLQNFSKTETLRTNNKNAMTKEESNENSVSKNAELPHHEKKFGLGSFEISDVQIPQHEEQRNSDSLSLTQEDERRETYVVVESVPAQAKLPAVQKHEAAVSTELAIDTKQNEKLTIAEKNKGESQHGQEEKAHVIVVDIKHEKEKENMTKSKTKTVTKQAESKVLKAQKGAVKPVTKKPLPVPVAFDVEQPPKKTKPTLTDKLKKTREMNATTKKTRKVKLKVSAKGVAPTKLKLVKPVKTSIPHHPMPFAAKNMYYDERWIEKQEAGFTRWLNFILTPPDDCDDNNTGSMTMGNTKAQPKAPSKEELSFKVYTTRRKMARLRRCACLLYQSEPVICVIRKIEAEVELGRLAIRSDKKIHADLGIKKNIVKMILSYNPLWLRIGLETIYGEILPVQSNNDTNGLANFITNHLLANQSIARTYAHPKVPGLYRDGYVQQLNKFTLKKFLFLVLFLDRAKLTRIIDHDPCLFEKHAEFKSSRDLLLTFSREYLKGEGDITKHLSYLGFSVTHQQRPVDEIDYAIHNIATDLRDGLKLTRVVELLTHNWQLTQNLRVPAISRLQKIHNVEVFMEELKQHKIPVGNGGGIDPRHIVDGHREKTLQLLWQIIFNFQVNVVLNEKQLKEEISFLEKNQALQVQLTTEPVMLGLPRNKRESLENDIYFKSPRLSLLLKWCKLICRQYGIKVDNFTVSFSDGRVLCFLLHFYHPSLLSLSMINQETTLSRNPGLQEDSDEEEGIVMDSWSANYSPGSGINREVERLKANEKENFKVLAEKVKELGGVPMMTKFSDMSNTIPDEKVVITYTSYLCARLLDLREETRAARKIQLAWKSYKLRQRLKQRQVLIDNVIKIQAYARSAIIRRRYIKIVQSTQTIQAHFRGYKERKHQHKCVEAARKIQSVFKATKAMQAARARFILLRNTVVALQARVRGAQCRRILRENHAALVIQSVWRGHVQNARFLALKQASLVCQKFARGRLARGRFQNIKKSVIVVQTRYRALKFQQEKREKFLQLRRSVIKLQAILRGFRARNFVKQLKATIVIQKNVKMKQHRTSFLLQKRAAIVIQAELRMYLAKKNYNALKHSTQVLQTYCRAYRVGKQERKAYQKLKSSTIKLQALWRGYSQQKSFQTQKSSVITIQTAFRRHSARHKYLEIRNSAITLQKFVRAGLQMKKARNDFQELRFAAVKIQALYRGQRCRKHYLETRCKLVKVQAVTRGFLWRREFLAKRQAVLFLQQRFRAFSKGRQQRLLFHIQRGAVITIQAFVRGFLVRQQLKRQNLVATRIQASFRRYMVTKKFTNLKLMTILLQRRFRASKEGKIERQKYLLVRQKAITIQAIYRGNKIRKRLQKEHFAATQIQATFKAFVQRRNFIKIRNTALILQTKFRALQQGKAARGDYEILRKAVITIQAIYRGIRARKEISEQRKAATTIQAMYRGHFQRQSYNKLRNATLLLQEHFRAWQLGKAKRKDYERLKKSAVKIQAIYRGNRIRRELFKQRKAAIVIQALYRCHLQRKGYNRIRCATFVLQAHFRALQLGKASREDYQRLKEAAIRVQAIYRGNQVRNNISKRQNAATVLQAMYRCYKQQKNYHRIRLATLVLQEHFRAFKSGEEARNNYKNLKSSTIKIQAMFRMLKAKKELRKLKAIVRIQAAFRGMITRRQIAHMNCAATKIQASFRAFSAFKKYTTLRQTTILIQARFRCCKQRNKFQKLRFAAVAIQAFYRGRKARDFVKQVKAVILIQSYYRMNKSRKNYLAARKEIIYTQACIRRLLAVKYYQKLRKAVIFIQQRHRANMALLKQYMTYHIQRGACIVLQASVRRYLVRKAFLELKAATVVLQERYRALVLARKQKQDFEETRNATIVIQKFARGMEARKLLRKHLAARKLQSFVRMYFAKKEYLMARRKIILLQARVRMFQERRRFQTLKKASLMIQTRLRATLLANAVSFNYRQMRQATIVIQKFYRGHLARKYCREIRSTIKIQAAYRGYVQNKKFLKLKNSAIRIQSFVRKAQAQTKYSELRQATVKLQQRYRGMLRMRFERQVYMETRNSAIIIQASFRRWKAKTRYTEVKKATIIVQTHFRATIEANKQRNAYTLMKKSAVVIQAGFRARKARMLFAEMRAARIIQAYYRMYRARTSYATKRQASIKLQSLVKMKIAREQFLQLKNSALSIQRVYRALILGELQRKKFLTQRQSAVKVQSVFRGHLARQRVQQMIEEKRRACEAATKIQQCYRGYRLTQETQLWFHYIRGAAITIQSWYRGYVARQLARRVRAVVRIQTMFRGMVAKRRYQTTRRHVIKLQSLIRCHNQRHRYLQLQHAALLCQRRYQATKTMQAQREYYSQYRLAVIKAQSIWRGRQERAWYRDTLGCVVLVQASIKCFLARRRFIQLKSVTISMQRRYRATCLAKEQQKKYRQIQSAALTMQSHYRGVLARKFVHRIMAVRAIQRRYRATVQGRNIRGQYLQTRAAAMTIQAFYRGHCARKVARMHAASRTLQAVVRGFLARRQFEELQEARRQKLTRFTAAVWYHLSVIRVQRSYRQAHALAVAKKQISSVLLIQYWWRAKLQRQSFLDMRKAAIVIQNSSRQRLNRKHKAASKIQALARGWLARRNVEKMHTAASVIQAWFRGYKVRSRVKSLKVKAARRRIKAANMAATESMKLCNRTRSALDYLLRCKNLTTIFDVLVNLEVVTRLSYVCCDQLVNDNALHIILTVMRNSNRSLPHMEILKYAVAILINLAKCPSTYRSIYDEPDAIPTLIELMTIFREKDQIFSKVCCVLTILARRDNAILQDFKNTPKMFDRVKGAHDIISRKQNLERRRSTIKAKMSQGTPYKNTTMTQTPHKHAMQTPYKSHTPYKPRKQSEWAMWQDYVNRVQEPLQAVRSLLKTLE